MVEEIQKIIDKYDPIDLYPGHMTPENEYDIEAKIIAEEYYTVSDLNTFTKDMENLFISSFSESVTDLKKIKRMSIDLFNYLSSLKK